ncbi:hypothetical protein AB0E78_27520 [Streptomyces sp. NPDC032198]|uniref:hypothetical protein n=1 Tax=Streptomyces sp. NPDC032198 TaxID=3155127 RepID=UPI0033F9BCE6
MGSVVKERRRWGRGVACCLVLGALVSCGAEGKGRVFEGLVERTPTESPAPADEVRGERLGREAVELLKNAESVRIGVEMNSPKGHQEVSVHMDRRSNCTGTFDSGPMQQGELVMVGGGSVYVRFSDASLDAIRDAAVARGPQIAARARERTALARGKYMKMPKGAGTSVAASPAKMCDLDKVFGRLGNGADTDMKGARALPEMRWHGEKVTPLAGTDGGHDMTAYVATGDKPYMVGMAQTRGDEQMEMRMSDYDKPVTAHAPDPSLVLDLEALGMDVGGGSLFEV